MLYLILLIFIAVPIAEIAVLIQVGGVIGVAPTILLVIGTAVAGVWLLKRQGVAVLAEARRTLDSGQLPVQPVIDGVCLLVAGAFLLTPGLITDTAGFLLLVPGFRRALAALILEKLQKGGHIDVVVSGSRRGGPRGKNPPADDRGPVIEGEFERVDDKASRSGNERGADEGEPRDPSSPWRRR